MKGRLSLRGANNTNTRQKKLTFKKNVPFMPYISKINNTFTDNTEDLDIIVSVYNLLKYSGNYSKMPGSLWSYFREKVNDSANGNNDASNYRIYNKRRTTNKPFE